MRSTRLIVSALAFGLCTGCTPSARYTRPTVVVATTSSYLVPRNWDYRTEYRLPVQRLFEIIQSYVGAPYHLGGTSRRGIDCSGLVYVVFHELNHARIPRTAKKLSQTGRLVQSDAALPGDLVFFCMESPGVVDHVGICVGNGRFVHASTSKGVTFSSLTDAYFHERLALVRRLFLPAVEPAAKQ